MPLPAPRSYIELFFRLFAFGEEAAVLAQACRTPAELTEEQTQRVQECVPILDEVEDKIAGSIAGRISGVDSGYWRERTNAETASHYATELIAGSNDTALAESLTTIFVERATEPEAIATVLNEVLVNLGGLYEVVEVA